MSDDDDPADPPSLLWLCIVLAVLVVLIAGAATVFGAPAPFPRPIDPRPLERVRRTLTGTWAMTWSGGPSAYEVTLSPCGRYIAWNHSTTYTGTWAVVREGRGLVLVIRERRAWAADCEILMESSCPHAEYRFALDPADPRRGKHHGYGGDAWGFRLSPYWLEK